MLPILQPANPFNSALVLPPQLVVLRQNSLAEDRIVKNGQTKNVHIVVKNSPFLVQLGLASRNGALVGKQGECSISQFSFEARLVYDVDPEKEVAWVKEKPMECKINVNDHQPGVVSAEVRLKVLSTQHEDLFFKVRFIAFDKVSRREVLQVSSAPIKVISKSDQVKKKKEPKQKKKRSTTDLLMETLISIERRQREHAEILYKLLGQPIPASLQSAPSYEGFDFSGVEVEDIDLEEEVGEVGDLLSEVASCLPAQTLQPISPCSSSPAQTEAPDTHAAKRSKGLESKEVSFENAFHNFLNAYNSLDPSQRRTQLQKAVASQDHQVTMELMDMLHTDGLQRSPPANQPFTHDVECQCGECPYKSELSRIEDFYREVFSITNVPAPNPAW